eukprot:symbB.v1.2.040090.t1/scaffold6982.1/size28864/2
MLAPSPRSEALRDAGGEGEGEDPPADSMGDASVHDGDGDGSDGESCYDDDTTVALGSPSPNLFGEEGDDNDKSTDEEKEFPDKRPMDEDDADDGKSSDGEKEFIDKRLMDASSTEGAMSPGGAMRRAYLAEGKEWPPTWDDGRPDFEAYRAAYITPAKRSHPVSSESGIKHNKAPKIDDSQQDKMTVNSKQDKKTKKNGSKKKGSKKKKASFRRTKRRSSAAHPAAPAPAEAPAPADEAQGPADGSDDDSDIPDSCQARPDPARRHHGLHSYTVVRGAAKIEVLLKKEAFYVRGENRGQVSWVKHGGICNAWIAACTRAGVLP